MTQKAAIRRRKQAVNGNKHVAKLGRRVYKKKSAGTYERQRMRVIEKQRNIAANKARASAKKRG